MAAVSLTLAGGTAVRAGQAVQFPYQVSQDHPRMRVRIQASNQARSVRTASYRPPRRRMQAAASSAREFDVTKRSDRMHDA